VQEGIIGKEILVNGEWDENGMMIVGKWMIVVNMW